MAINLALFKATKTDGSGSITADTANLNGLHDKDQSTNVLEIAANQTFIIHYDMAENYQMKQCRIYASAVSTAYWTVEVSLNNSDWTSKTVASGGTYIYANINGGYRYVKITCDATGEAAINPREYEIDADATLMKYQAGTSDVIGSTTDSGSATSLNVWNLIVDSENSAPSDGYLVAFKGYTTNYFYVYILRDIGSYWKVVQKHQYSAGGIWPPQWSDIIFDPPLKFEAGDIIAVQSYSATSNFRRQSAAGKSYYYKYMGTAPSVGDSLEKSTFTEVSDYEMRLYSVSHGELVYGSTRIPIPDRYLTGSAGASTNPKIVNQDVLGTTPWLDFYPVISSLSAEINSSQTTIAFHDAANFPQSAVGGTYGGRFQIQSEKVYYDYMSSDDAVGCLRGAGGTSPVGHCKWTIVEDISPYVEISKDNVNFYGPESATPPLALDSSIAAGGNKTFYLRSNLPFTYLEDKQIYSTISVLWGV